jgi:hypothetical protein
MRELLVISIVEVVIVRVVKDQQSRKRAKLVSAWVGMSRPGLPSISRQKEEDQGSSVHFYLPKSTVQTFQARPSGPLPQMSFFWVYSSALLACDFLPDGFFLLVSPAKKSPFWLFWHFPEPIGLVVMQVMAADH